MPTESMNMDSNLRFLTNRGNLLDALSTGCIRPGVAMEKWYPDLSSEHPDLLVFLKADPSPRLADSAGDPAAGQFPVLLELRTAAGYFVVSQEFSPEGGQDPDPALVVFAIGTVPSGQISRVVFRSDEDLAEFTAREYDNIRTDLQRMRFIVDPSRFRGTAEMAPDAPNSTWTSTVDPASFDASSQTASLILILGTLFERSNDLELEQYADALGYLRQQILDPARENIRRSDAPALARWIVEHYLRHHRGEELDGREAALLDLVLTVAAGTSPEEFGARSFLGTLGDVASANGMPSESLTLMRDAIDGLADADNLVASMSQIESALLTFLRRPEPPRLLSWMSEQNPPDSITMLIATVFAGLTSRRPLISLDARPSNENLERIIDTWLSAWLSKDEIDLGKIDALKLPLEIARDDDRITLMAGDSPLVARSAERGQTSPAPQETEPLEAISTDSGISASTGEQPGSASSEGASGDPVELLLASPLTEPRHVEAALVLCEKRPWSDLVQTRIKLGGIAFSLNRGRKSAELWLTVEKLLSSSDLEFVFDVPSFRAALVSDRAKITKSMESRISGILNGTEAAIKPTAGKSRAARKPKGSKQMPEQIGFTD